MNLHREKAIEIRNWLESIMEIEEHKAYGLEEAIVLALQNERKRTIEECVEKIQKLREKYVERSPLSNKVLWEAIEEIQFKDKAIRKLGDR